MSSDERRIAPRKVFSIPIRFRALASEAAPVAVSATASEGMTSSSIGATKPMSMLDMEEGETVNLSERGLYFKSEQKVGIGQSVEVYLTLPLELTGRNPEPVRCNERVVHVEQDSDERGRTGVGAAVERFESLQRFRTWDN